MYPHDVVPLLRFLLSFDISLPSNQFLLVLFVGSASLQAFLNSVDRSLDVFHAEEQWAWLWTSVGDLRLEMSEVKPARRLQLNCTQFDLLLFLVSWTLLQLIFNSTPPTSISCIHIWPTSERMMNSWPDVYISFAQSYSRPLFTNRFEIWALGSDVAADPPVLYLQRLPVLSTASALLAGLYSSWRYVPRSRRTDLEGRRWKHVQLINRSNEPMV